MYMEKNKLKKTSNNLHFTEINKNINLLDSNNKISSGVLEKLKIINANKSKNFPQYKKAIKTIFNITKIPKITKTHKLFLAGFIIGEGSMNVSAKKSENSRFGVVIDPEFSITQHLNKIEYLYAALCFFNTGKITFKSKSNATLVYKISNRESLEKKVLPFWETYVSPFQSEKHKQRFNAFKELLLCFRKKHHLDFSSFKNEILFKWDFLRKQKNQKNQSFSDLHQAQLFVENHVNKKKLYK